jgi:hypothetical protein
MSETWYEEELIPTSATIEQIAKATSRSLASVQAQVDEQARGKLRVTTPDWARLSDTSNLLTSGRPADFYRVRLGFEFEVTPAGEATNARFVYAVCAAYLWSATPSAEQPRVYELYPRDYYDEDKPPAATFDLGPELKVGEVGGSLGKVSVTLPLGSHEPVVVGYVGEQERAPRWELRPKSQTLRGVRYFWLLIQVPQSSGGVRLATRAEGDVQTVLGRIPIGPKQRAWEPRPSVLIR